MWFLGIGASGESFVFQVIFPWLTDPLRYRFSVVVITGTSALVLLIINGIFADLYNKHVFRILVALNSLGVIFYLFADMESILSYGISVGGGIAILSILYSYIVFFKKFRPSDPQQFMLINRRIQSLNKTNYDITAASEPAEVLNALVENYIYKQANGISHVPTAVVINKTDLLEALSYEADYLRPRSNVFTRYVHHGHLNMTETDIVNYEMDEFIQRVDPNFRNALKRRFANLGLFGVSPLGASPDAIRQRVAGVAPVRVDEPLLWILYKLGYIDGYYEGARL